MGKRGRKTGLTAVFWRYLAVCGALTALTVALWWAALSACMRAGLVLPANAGEEASRALIVRVLDGEPFDARAVPHYVRWARFGADGGVLESAGMDGARLDAARAELSGGSFARGFPYPLYHRSAFLPDGSALVLQYDYAMPYAGARLARLLPDFQLASLGLLAALIALECALATRGFARALRRDARALAAAANAVANRRLDAPLDANVRVRELSDALEAIESLRASLSEALKAQWAAEQRARDELASLSHDLRTPLTTITGYADLLLESAPDGETARSARAILGEAERLRAYAAGLDALARGGESEERSAAEVASLFADWRAAGEALCAARGVRFEARCEAEGEAAVLRGTLERAVVNLLDNAARYAREGGLVALVVRREAGTLRVRVEDDGPGFSAEALARAGYALYTDAANRPADGHRGMGLCMARGAAERHGGALTLSNRAQGGACASLTLRV